MLSRRVLAASIAAACTGRAALAEVDPDGATRFIQATGQELIQLMSGASTAEMRRVRLRPFIERVVDVDGVARFCIGRGWQTATEEQRAAYLRLFRVVLVNSVSGHLGDYAPGEVSIATGRAAARPEGQYVPTVISRPNNKPVTIGWLVADVSGAPRIIDVSAEGVSLRVTQRSDYAAFLNRNNGQISALIDALQKQVDGLHLS